MVTKWYAGVGSRKTPQDVLALMTEIAFRLSDMDIGLRSGGALGADRAFETGARVSQIFLAHDSTEQAEAVAAQFHPVWSRLKPYYKQLHGRNSFQVLGHDLQSPSCYVICWTPDGAISHQERTIKTGGTGTAISIASAHGIPVFNLQRPDHRARLEAFVAK
jgi:hypothetical protein